ncbi:MAG: ATP-binding cassette domain-containing protein [Bacilli bacterium]
MKNDVVIKVDNVTKDYGDKKGVFNESFEIKKGQMVGFVGTNGSGKTTTIRSILGFIKTTSGHCYVNGLESWSNSSKILKKVGYVPGEISFPDLGTGIAFIHSQAEFLHLKNFDRANYLIEKLQLDPRANLKRMSKGMKQKTALVAALMDDPEIIILDEPTTGLDPLMRESFLEIIEEEHKKGKTILMSSHMFEEIEETCDSVLLISNGHLIDHVSMQDITHHDIKEYKIEFNKKNDYKIFQKEKYKITRLQDEYNQVTVQIPKEQIEELFKSLKGMDLKFISENPYTLEKHFIEKIKNVNEEGGK